MRKFYLFYKDSELVQQLGGQLKSIDIKTNTIVQQPAGQLQFLGYCPKIYKIKNMPTTEELENEINKMI